jgi:glycosyltransferase involved in cell wall biosynthesis
MHVSVVIPAHNESRALPECLGAFANQQTRHQFDIIVVDNASTDETSAVAEAWKEKLDLRVIHESKKGRGNARRRGFSEAKTDIILSTDADSTVPSNWVESLVYALICHPKVVAASGSSYITDGTKITNWTMRVGMPASLRLYRLLIGHYMLTGANFAIRREAYERSGGFDPSRDILDDVDLAFRVSKIGQIIYLRTPKVLTEGDIFRKGYIRGFYHYARHLPTLLKKYWFKGDYSIG